MNMYLVLWFVLWLLAAFIISKYTQSMVIRIGGGFIVTIFTFILIVGAGQSWFEYQEEQRAKNRGYQSVEHYNQGAKQGFASGKQYYDFLAKKKAEAAARQKQLELRAKEEERKKKVQREAERKRKAVDCRKDLKCWARSDEASAIVYCKNMIERMAKYDHQWLDDSWLVSTFSHYRWKSQRDGSVTYIGDKLKLQNGFSAWSNYVYSCDFDVNNDKVLDVQLLKGKL